MNEIIKRNPGFVRIVNEPAKSRIERGECPSCGKPKADWTRRKDWLCCSSDCTNKFENFCVIRHWPGLRDRIFERDNYTCKHCGAQPKAQECESTLQKDGSYSYQWVQTDKPDSSKLVADHIKPIALGGEQWDENNIQTLCIACNKIKTHQDIKEISKLRYVIKKTSGGQHQLEAF